MSFRSPSESKEQKTVVFANSPKELTYGDLQKAKFDNGFIVTCHICGDDHSTKSQCASRPPHPVSIYHDRCPCCYGFHPKGRCYYEYLREILLTPTFCKRCQLTHKGYCSDPILCTFCRRRHNFGSECQQQITVDLSNNPCLNCGLIHSLHCPPDLAKLRSDVKLWCNKCKIEHKLSECVPFCSKCMRRHQLVECPPNWTYCLKCTYAHSGGPCSEPKTDLKKKKQETRRSAEYP